MKKIVSVILTVCLIASMTVTALAATMSAAVNPKTIKAGEKVTVTVSLNEKIDNVVTYAYKLYFDADLFSLESSEKGTSHSLTTVSAVRKDKVGSYINISVADPNSTGVTINAGTVYTLVFTAKEDVAGNQTATFNLVFGSCKDPSYKDITGVDAGAAVSVTVEGAHVHSWTKAKDAKAATCKEAGNIEYYTCSCGKYAKLENGKYVEIALADTVIPKTNKHTLKPVDAVVSTTCGSDDVAAHYECTVCGKLFSDAAGKNETTIDKLTTKKAHTLVKVDAVAATCTTNGTKEHYKCTNESCGRLFTDAAGKNETTADKLVIPAAHKLVKTDAKAATCTTPGNKEYWTCDVCKKVFSDAAGKNKIALADTTIAALGHKLTKTDKVDSTCTATGHEAYWTCSRCKGIFADEQGATATTLDNLTIAKKAHTSGDYVTNATEHFKTCSVCGTEIEKSREKHTFVKDDTTGVETCKCGYAIGGKVDENHQHAAGNDWFRDENNHWHKCTDPKCTAHVGEAKHDFKTVSTTKDGNKTTTVEKCETCGYVKTTTVDNTPVTPVNPSKPGRPSGTKTVQSGKTFDAGVGVYVGLSILSLTGSAVVIGKKRKTR